MFPDKKTIDQRIILCRQVVVEILSHLVEISWLERIGFDIRWAEYYLLAILQPCFSD